MDAIGYIILLLYFAVLIVIGLLCSRKQDSLSDFFLAGRSTPAWAAMAAVVATETSAVTFLAAPAKAFSPGGDFSFLQVVLGYIVARFILALFFLPRFFEREIVTIYEFVGLRFGQDAKRLSGIFFFVTRAMAAGVRHYAAALVLNVILGIDLTAAIIVTGLISLAYCYLGGISAVIWTEVVQLAVMMIGGLLAFFYLYGLIPGGWGHIVEAASAEGKWALIHWDWSGTGQYSFFMGLLGGMCLCLASHGADQDLVQRLLSCRSLRSAQIAIIGSGFFVFLQFAFFLLVGVMLFAFYQGAIPEAINKSDQILPYFSVHNMHSASAALVIAAVLSAALSSTASALNSLSSTSVNDFVMAMRKEPLSNKQLIQISRLFTIGWTVILIVIALIAGMFSESLLDTALSIPSYTYGSLLAAFLLGIFTPFRRARGMMIGMMAGVAGVLIISFFRFHWTWFVPVGAMTSIGTAYLTEWLFPSTSFGSID